MKCSSPPMCEKEEDFVRGIEDGMRLESRESVIEFSRGGFLWGWCRLFSRYVIDSG